MTIDLVRPALRPGSRRSEPETVVIKLEMGVSVLVAALLAAMTIQLGWVARSRARIDREIVALQPQWTIVREQQKEIRSLTNEAQAIRGVLRAPQWVDLLEVLRAALPHGAWLTRVTASEDGSLQVVLRSAEPTAAAEFIGQLQLAGLEDVRLTLSEQVRVEGGEVVQVSVAARVPVVSP